MSSQNLPETPFPHSPSHQPANSDLTLRVQSTRILPNPNEPHSSKKVGKWTPEEDTLLRKFVSMFSEKQWKKISEQIPGRTPIQCLHRWTKILKPGLVKGPWTPEEDQKLLAWVKKEGPGKWAQAANLIPGRSGKQCRERWFNNLNPEVKKGNWSTAEDELIFDLYQKYGSSWSKIAKYIPGRTENSIKNRFYSTLRKLAATKNRSFSKPVSPDFEEHEGGGKGGKMQGGDGNVRMENSTSEHEPNLLYNLLQEIVCNEKEQQQQQQQQKEQENKENIDVKQEEGTEKEVNKQMEKQPVKIRKEQGEENKKIEPESENKEKERMQEERIPLRNIGETNRPQVKADQQFNVNGEKVVLTRNTFMPEKVIHEAANKLMKADIEDSDPSFEKFLLSWTQEEYKQEGSNLGFQEGLDALQKKIYRFCSENVHDLMSAFNIVSGDPHRQVTESKEISPVKSEGDNQLTTQYNQNQILAHRNTHMAHGGHNTPTKQGFRRRLTHHSDLKQTHLSNQKLSQAPFKIPPLDTKENDEVKIPKFMGFEEQDLTGITLAPSKGPSKENLLKMPGVLEQKSLNKEISKTGHGHLEKQNHGFGTVKKEEKDLDSLIGSISHTIETASIVYSHYIKHINEAVKTMDQNDTKEAREQIRILLQQLQGLESWLKNAKVELLRLQGSVQNPEGKGSLSVEGDLGKRRITDENSDVAKWEQPVKKRKVE